MFSQSSGLVGFVSVVVLVAGVSPVLAAPEACCFDSTGCLNLEPGDCTIAGGIPRGAGTTCTGVDCSSSGSCCEAGGGCSDGLSGFICANSGGTYLGDGTTCQGTENSCADGQDNDCDGNADCADADCTGTAPCLPSGACCLTNGGCLELTLDDCDVVPNSGWAGPATTCADSFPAEDSMSLCCDTFDNDCDGFTDASDANCVGFSCANSPATAPFPHDRRKNRYISFTPNSGTATVAFRVQKTTTPTGSCWVQAPVQFANAIPAQDTQYTAKCGPDPVFRVWTEPVVHVGDCAIIPVADYVVFANAAGPLENPTGLAVGTILLPSSNGKMWGDTVGINDGTDWTPPNQFTNVQDVLGLMALITANSVRPHFTVGNLQATSSDNSCLNASVGTADVLISVQAIAGASYGPPSSVKIIDPALCPVCP